MAALHSPAARIGGRRHPVRRLEINGLVNHGDPSRPVQRPPFAEMSAALLRAEQQDADLGLTRGRLYWLRAARALRRIGLLLSQVAVRRAWLPVPAEDGFRPQHGPWLHLHFELVRSHLFVRNDLRKALSSDGNRAGAPWAGISPTLPF
jgi:hypothetical protein